MFGVVNHDLEDISTFVADGAIDARISEPSTKTRLERERLLLRSLKQRLVWDLLLFYNPEIGHQYSSHWCRQCINGIADARKWM